MALVSFLVFFFPFHLHLLLLVGANYTDCQQSFQCGDFELEFPFTDTPNPGCGLIMVDGCDSDGRTAKTISGPGYSYTILEKIPPNKFLVRDTTTYEKLEDFLSDRNCDSLRNLSMPQIYPLSFTFPPNISLFTCFNQTFDERIQDHFRDYRSIDCQSPSSSSTMYYYGNNPTADREGSGTIPTECSMTQLPLNPEYRDSDDLHTLLYPNFTLEWSVPQGCFRSGTSNEYSCKQGII